MLRWDFSKARFCGIPQKKLRTFQHGAECQRWYVLEKVLVALMASFQVVIGNPFIEVMNVVEANIGGKPLQ
jgi:hypothetical protein